MLNSDERRYTYSDVTSTCLGSGISKQGENRVRDLIRVVKVERGADFTENVLVRMLLWNLAADGESNREGEEGEEEERLDEDHGENYVCGAWTGVVVSTKGGYASDL